MAIKQIPPEVNPNSRWLTVAEASKYVRVSPGRLRHLIHAGQLKAIHGITRGYLLDQIDLDQFLERKKKTVAPYRRGTHGWVAKRHAENRRKRASR